jgi:predicted DNA-binding transcriptional regulator AlpA
MRFVSYLPDNLPIFLTGPQLSNLLGVSTSSIRDYVRKGILPPPLMLTRRIHLWQTSEVRAWIRRWAPEALREKPREDKQEVENQPEPGPEPPSQAV